MIFPANVLVLLQRAARDRDTAINESQIDAATESGSDRVSDANGSENSGGEVCTSSLTITSYVSVMCPLPSLETTGEMVWAYGKHSW